MRGAYALFGPLTNAMLLPTLCMYTVVPSELIVAFDAPENAKLLAKTDPAILAVLAIMLPGIKTLPAPLRVMFNVVPLYHLKLLAVLAVLSHTTPASRPIA